MTRINLNQIVRIRLTETGREILRQDTDKLNAWIRKKNPGCSLLAYDTVIEDSGGWSRWQLWSVMQIFGSAIGPGQPPPFATEIDIEPDPAAAPAASTQERSTHDAR